MSLRFAWKLWLLFWSVVLVADWLVGEWLGFGPLVVGLSMDLGFAVVSDVAGGVQRVI